MVDAEMALDEGEMSVSVGGEKVLLNPLFLGARRMAGIAVDVPALLRSHGDILLLFARAHRADEEELPLLAREYRDIQLRQQRLWGLPMDERFHHWTRFPRCSCAREQPWPSQYREVSRSCPVHGPSVASWTGLRPGARSPLRMSVQDADGRHLGWREAAPGHVVVDIDCPLDGRHVRDWTPASAAPPE